MASGWTSGWMSRASSGRVRRRRRPAGTARWTSTDSRRSRIGGYVWETNWRSSRPFGRKQRLKVRALAERHIAKAEARQLYEDLTPPPTPEEIELRRQETHLSRGDDAAAVTRQTPAPRAAARCAGKRRRQRCYFFLAGVAAAAGFASISVADHLVVDRDLVADLRRRPWCPSTPRTARFPSRSSPPSCCLRRPP